MNLAPRDRVDLDVKAAIVLRLTEGEDFSPEGINLVRAIREDASHMAGKRGTGRP